MKIMANQCQWRIERNNGYYQWRNNKIMWRKPAYQ
jgi:hypothetical protein